MTSKNIIITDILELENIDDNTPIIIIKNIPSKYLINPYNNIYWIDIENLYNILVQKVNFINKFLPVGQIKTNKKYFTAIFANSKIIPTTKYFEKIKNNEWYGIIKKNGKINRSISSIKSIKKPDISIPVFPINFLLKYTETSYNKNIYKDTYSHKSFGKWTLNRYMFNIDKTNLKMIDSAGNISNMCIPDSNINIFRNEIKDNIYFTTQGNISNNDNNISPDNSDNISMHNYDIVYNTTVNKKIKRKKIVLKEKGNPWYLDYNIVGGAINTDNPHKVTGLSISDSSNDISNNTSNINVNLTDTNSDTQNNSIIVIVCFLVFIFAFLRIIKYK